MKRLLFLIPILLMVASIMSPTTEAIKTKRYCMTAEEQQLLALVNIYRISNGKRPMFAMQSLGAAAEHHSRAMATDDWFGHDFPDGTTWTQNMNNHGYTFNTWRGENLTAGQSNAVAAFDSWLNSEGHRLNMLGDDFVAAGVGYAYNKDSTYRHYWTLVMASHHEGTVRYC